MEGLYFSLVGVLVGISILMAVVWANELGVLTAMDTVG